ncbi:major capsid protein [Desulfovibrio litoralis]|uniref:Phage protein n=1 Tax=Desulfovibrio litoralis DSM 11393 TaxID=1121455 RepID=A0A1M7T7Z0_9BACT|nr:hypothetical protein [Desulfovibrio litoralis]SHN66840.1 hypothetical protein SAMN02745728_01699 [Desulfovibrio litoralis DSM 11393]
MPVVAQKNPTFSDIAKRLDPNGKVDIIVETLKNTNEILEDAVVLEGNLPTGNKTTMRSGLPSVAWRMINQGVQPSKSTTVQQTDNCGNLEAYAEIDKDLADLNGNTASYRVSEDSAFLEAMNQQMANTLFYGDTSKNPERFLGLAPRFNTLDVKKAASAENVIDAKGTASGKLSSIWLMCWGAQTVHCFYPKGSKAGFVHTDKGQVTLQDGKGGNFEGYRSHYKWSIGLSVRDWRYVVRIANIDLATITDDALIEAMVSAVESLPNQNLGKPVFYVNKNVRKRLRNAIRRADNVHLGIREVAGKKVVDFDEIPVRRSDALVNTETRVV